MLFPSIIPYYQQFPGRSRLDFQGCNRETAEFSRNSGKNIVRGYMILYINIPRTIFLRLVRKKVFHPFPLLRFPLKNIVQGNGGKPGKNEINTGECRKTAREFSFNRGIREHWPRGTFLRSGSCVIGAWAEGAGSLRGRSRSGRGSARESLPVLVGALPGFGDGVGAVAAKTAGLRLSFLL